MSRLSRWLWRLEHRMRAADNRMLERQDRVRQDIAELDRAEQIREGPWLPGDLHG